MSDDNLKDVYDKLCASYQGIDTFRARLLGLLPLATGSGIFLLYSNLTAEAKEFLGPIGLFGFAITLGLFAYEVYGIRKCGALISAGIQMEGQLGIDGQFTHRPHEVFGVVNEPFASGIIYPAVLAAWAFVGSRFVLPEYAWLIALAVFLAGFGFSIGYNQWLKSLDEVPALARLNQKILRAEEEGDRGAMAKLLSQDFSIVRASGEKQDRQTFLNKVPENKNRGRRADRVEVRLFDYSAVFTCRVTTTRDKDGKDAIDHFWNTRLFVRQGTEWCCVSWQVAKLPNN